MIISEVCAKYDLTPDTLRYYEKIGLIPTVPRTEGGIRDYDVNSCKWVELMKCMRAAGVQIDALVEYVKLFQQGDSTLRQRKAILVEQREILQNKISEMSETLQHLNYKIDNYDKILCLNEVETKPE